MPLAVKQLFLSSSIKWKDRWTSNKSTKKIQKKKSAARQIDFKSNDKT